MQWPNIKSLWLKFVRAKNSISRLHGVFSIYAAKGKKKKKEMVQNKSWQVIQHKIYLIARLSLNINLWCERIQQHKTKIN